MLSTRKKKPPLDFARLIRRLPLLATVGKWLKLFCRSDGAFCLSVPFSSESGDGLEVCTFGMDELVIVNYVTGEASPMQTS
ncbi:hypothetical protein DY000_02043299 [Brassica cretica]|uniref:F-box associated domain-containing protein n=1 Tax=Brassica cretica TaxID=69181 RepID=A0ABQ7BFF9_BRACR|nr:hypothetical protein DY000_02043299 [Brassica cretica]